LLIGKVDKNESREEPGSHEQSICLLQGIKEVNFGEGSEYSKLTSNSGSKIRKDGSVASSVKVMVAKFVEVKTMPKDYMTVNR
jgi:hypothetical protein